VLFSVLMVATGKIAVFSVRSSALIAKSVDSSETSVNIYQTACAGLVFGLSEGCVQDVGS
jgi:hypothetical protein